MSRPEGYHALAASGRLRRFAAALIALLLVDQVVETSLGYFINPLVTVAFGVAISR